VNFQYYFFAIVFIAMDIAGMIYVMFSTAGSGASWFFVMFALVLLVPLFYVMSGGRYDS
jgi:NADH-quinone oxidoreductase subunit A